MSPSSSRSPNRNARTDTATVGEGAEPTPVVFIIGAGVVGTALAARLSWAGVPVAGVHGRQTGLSEAAGALSGVLASTGELPDIVTQSDVIIISVRDERIPEITQRLVREKRLRPNQVLLHTSGAHPSGEVLAAARGAVRGLGTLHPLVSFADPHLAAEGMRGAAFAVEGDPAARAAALRLVQAAGGQPLLLEADNMALYHAGAVVASNYVVALADIAKSMLVKAGVPEQRALPALVPLLTSAVRNLGDVGLPDAITGPIVRGDVLTIGRHIKALSDELPGELEIYRRLGREVLRIVREKGGLEEATAARIAALLEAEVHRPSKDGRGKTPAQNRGRPAARSRTKS